MSKSSPPDQAFRKRQIPECLQGVYFDFHWSQEKLWALKLDNVEMKVADLEWALDHPILASQPPERLYDLKPNSILENPRAFPGHWRRIQNADTSYPIHVMFWRERWLIMDGFHRLMKRKTEGREFIDVFQVPQSAIDSIQPDAGLPADFLSKEMARRDKSQKDES